MRTSRLLVAGAGLLVSVLLVRGLVAAPLTVSSTSMEPTVPEGATVLVDKLGPRLLGVHRGDLVVFTSPDDGGQALKRVVAVAGQQVALRDAVLHVDGVAVHEPRVDLSRIDGTYFGPVTVPPDAVFVLGDNRAGSIDSRDYGAVPLSSVSGRVLVDLGF